MGPDGAPGHAGSRSRAGLVIEARIASGPRDRCRGNGVTTSHLARPHRIRVAKGGGRPLPAGVRRLRRNTTARGIPVRRTDLLDLLPGCHAIGRRGSCHRVRGSSTVEIHGDRRKQQDRADPVEERDGDCRRRGRRPRATHGHKHARRGETRDRRDGNLGTVSAPQLRDRCDVVADPREPKPRPWERDGDPDRCPDQESSGHRWAQSKNRTELGVRAERKPLCSVAKGGDDRAGDDQVDVSRRPARTG